MSEVVQTMTMDTSGLSRAIPLASVAAKRTVEEQAITSMGWILVNAQRETGYVQIATMDAELDAVWKITSRKAPGRAAIPRATPTISRTWTIGMMIAVQRTNPNSVYSRMTGNRWPAAKPTGPRGSQENFFYFQMMADRMKKSRHSSAHFLQAGYKTPIKLAFGSPLFQHSKKYRNANAAISEANNSLNTVDSSQLGALEIAGEGSGSIVLRGENNVGEKGNPVLDKKHRTALLEISGPKLQAAIYAEEANLTERGELGRRMDDYLIPVQKLLS